MARVMYEFFRPRLSQPGLFLIGLLVQDGETTVYGSLPDVQLPEDVDALFYGLGERESLMNQDLLDRVELPEPDGTRSNLPRADDRLLPALRDRGTHHFIYGEIKTTHGDAESVLEQEFDRLADRDERRRAVLEVADPTTRALIEAYA